MNEEPNENNYRFKPWRSEDEYQSENLRTLTLIETDNYKVFTLHSIFQRHFIKWPKEHPHLTEDFKMLKLIDQAMETVADLNCQMFFNNTTYASRLAFRAGDLLELNKCMILDKKTFQLVGKIRIVKSEEQIADLIGSGWRTFFVNETKILELQDWIS